MAIDIVFDDENEDIKNAPVILPGQGSAVPDQIQQQMQNKPMATPEELFKQTGSPQPEVFPTPKTKVDVEFEKPGVGQRVWNRFWGTDVEDPLPWSRLASQLFGALGGAAAGGKAGMAMGEPFGPMGRVAGGAIGALGGGVAGVSAGSVAPEASMSLAEAMKLVDPGYREENGLSNEDLRTVVEGEALLELATGGLLSGLRAGGRGLSRLATKQFAEGRGIANNAAEFGIDLMPVQTGKGKIAKAFVNVMGQFPWVGSKISAQGALVDQQARYAVEHLPARIAPAFSSPAISRQIIDDVSALSKRVDKYFGDAYGALDREAARMGVIVRPNMLVSRGDEIISKIAERTPTAGTGATNALEKVKGFVNSEILSLRTDLGGGPVIAEQAFSHMRGLTDKINEQITMLVKDGVPFKSRPVKMLVDLKQAAQADILTNVMASDPKAAKRLMADYKDLNAHFSETINELFESAGARRFTAVRKAGARGTGEGLTKVPTDNLTRLLLRDESPEIVRDIHRIVTPETFRNMTANYLGGKINAAMKIKGSENTFNNDAFKRMIGLNDKSSPRYAQMKEMLSKSGGLSMDELEKLTTTMDAVSDLPIPKMSQFIARRATLGGFRAIKNAIVPGLLTAGAAGSTAGAVSGDLGVGAMASGLSFLLGSRFFANMISNPNNAKSLRYVMKNEVNRYAWKNAMFKLYRGTLNELYRDGTYTAEEFSRLQREGGIFINETVNEVLDYNRQMRQEQ